MGRRWRHALAAAAGVEQQQAGEHQGDDPARPEDAV